MFAPPQVPASISPQRAPAGRDGVDTPFARPTQRPQSHSQPFPSPQSYGNNDQIYGNGSAHSSTYGVRTTQYSGNSAGQPGVMPTPDPTIASCISDEDVAMQLIRLGDASNFSHGRTSASTLDDGFSGAADAASSTGATSDGEDFTEDDDSLSGQSRQKLESSHMLPQGAVKHERREGVLPSFDGSDQSADEADEDYRYDGRADRLAKSEFDDDGLYMESGPKAKKAKTRTTSASVAKPRKPSATKSSRNSKLSSSAGVRKTKGSATASQKLAMVTQTASSGVPLHHHRKASASSASHQLAADEEDLSTKPRCQRCRKSKKGCDRQRPCGRCKDAGVGVEGCISEDEGNGRKGRYGRHMGVPVKKAFETASSNGEMQIDADAFSSSTTDKIKKRKR